MSGYENRYKANGNYHESGKHPSPVKTVGSDSSSRGRWPWSRGPKTTQPDPETVARVNRLLDMLDQEERETDALEKRQKERDQQIGQIRTRLDREEGDYDKDKNRFTTGLRKLDEKIDTADGQISSIRKDVKTAEDGTKAAEDSYAKLNEGKRVQNIPVATGPIATDIALD